MKKKIILCIVFLAAVLMILTPTISAIKIHTVETTIKEKINNQTLGIRNMINRILGLLYLPIGVIMIPFAFIIGIITLILSPIAGWLFGDINQGISNAFQMFKEVMETPILLIYLGIYLIFSGEWPDFQKLI